MTPTGRPEAGTPSSDDLNAHLDEALDEALEESFPASDPVAVHRPEDFT